MMEPYQNGKLTDRYVGHNRLELDPLSPEALQGTAADTARAELIDRKKAESDHHAQDPIEMMLRCYDPATPRNPPKVPEEGTP